MGAHIYADDVPQMCFNGAKSWYFGWYSDHHKAIDPRNGHWNGKLVGIDDYLKKQTSKNEHTVVAKIGTLFVMYNRKEGINSEVAGDGDTVTIVEQAGPQQQSWKRAALTESSTPFRQRNWAAQTRISSFKCANVDLEHQTTRRCWCTWKVHQILYVRMQDKRVIQIHLIVATWSCGGCASVQKQATAQEDVDGERGKGKGHAKTSSNRVKMMCQCCWLIQIWFYWPLQMTHGSYCRIQGIVANASHPFELCLWCRLSHRSSS